MPRLDQTVRGRALFTQASFNPPFGPGFEKEIIEASDRMEIWMSNFEEATDYVTFKLFKDEQLISSKTLNGY